MSLTIKDVEYVANLARLELTAEARERFARQLADVLGYIGKLNELNTENVEPLVNGAAMTNVFRDDRAQAALPREKALANAPEQAKGFYKVPRVIE